MEKVKNYTQMKNSLKLCNELDYITSKKVQVLILGTSDGALIWK